MAELVLDRDERLALKAQAHALNPVVLLGAAGLSTAVLAEIDRALASHGLIKVRIPSSDRNEREALFAEIADRLAAARIQAIGKLAVLYRPLPAEPEPPPGPRTVRSDRKGAQATGWRGPKGRAAGEPGGARRGQEPGRGPGKRRPGQT